MSLPQARSLLRTEQFRFEFVGHGSLAEANLKHSQRLYLDVGNALREGVVDHHHLSAYLGSTASLVLAHPRLVQDAVDPARAGEPFTIVLHRQPDLDGVSSAYLTQALLTAGAFPGEAGALARFVDAVDLGRPGMSQQHPFTIYAAYMVVAHRVAQRRWADEGQMWRQCVLEGMDVVRFVLDQMASQGKSVLEVDAFECPGLFGPDDRSLVEQDIERFRSKLRLPATHARQCTLKLPGQLGGLREVDALLARNVEGTDDPQRCLFFKDWARSDTAFCEHGKGFAVTSVFQDESPGNPRRCIIAVSPDSQASLRGMGGELERAESEVRQRQSAGDVRRVDPLTGAALECRPGYDNPDPWYDGRMHAYSIVDSPRSGTALSADEIEDALLRFGRRDTPAEEFLLERFDDELDESVEPGANAVRTLADVVSHWNEAPERRCVEPAPEVFISYPHSRMEWVRRSVYEPLAEWRGPNAIFFDQHQLGAGAAWLAKLAAAIANCRLFLAIYSGEYFRSAFCQWELQLAILRDPLNARPTVVPLAIEDVSRPHYCRLIQFRRLDPEETPGQVVEILRSILE